MQDYLADDTTYDYTPMLYVLAGVVAVIGLALLCVMNYTPY